MSATDSALERQDGHLSLTLDPVPENAAVARHAIGDLAHRYRVAGPVRTSAEVVVTEAFTNATRHAYPNDSKAPVEIRASAATDRFEITVRDRGAGFRPRPASPGGGGRMGLLLIAAVADSVRFVHLADGGIEVQAAVTPESASRGLREPVACDGDC
jgi:anti-sigma regulatory factor (Ser/Thr protein kinase)